MTQAFGDMKGFLFACTQSSQEECIRRLLFGSDKQYGAVALRVKRGDFLFLLNLETDLLYGVFRAATDGTFNIEPEAWKGKYPYQVRVYPVGDLIPLKNAKKLEARLRITRSSPLSISITGKLLELYRPDDIPIDKQFEYFSREEREKQTTIREPKVWAFVSPVRENKYESVEEIPQLQSTTLWDFPRQSYGKTSKGDNKYPGVTPAGLVWNLVWRYTEPGDLVVDPMCGSGTTLDICTEERRRCICYDISPVRPDVIQNDARHIPLPENHVDLVFVDSPYGDNIRYNEHPDDIGKISSETEPFYDELEKVIDECYRILKPGKVLGWLIGDQWVKKQFTPVGFNLYQRLCKKFETVDIICIARRGQSSHTGVWFNRALRFNFYLRGFKYLFIMRKPSENKTLHKNRNANWTFYPRERKKPRTRK